MALEARCVFVSFKVTPGNSLAVQWSERSTSPEAGLEGGPGPILGWGTKMSQAMWCSQINNSSEVAPEPQRAAPTCQAMLEVMMVVIKTVMTAADTACCIFTARPDSKCFTNRSHLTLTCGRKERLFPRFADGNIM